SIKDGTEVIGNRARVKVAKNKVAPPFRMAEFDIMYGKGISREGSLLDVGIDLGIVKKSGAWFTYEGEQLGQGREKAKQFLTENIDLMFEISEKIKDVVGIEEIPVEPEADAEVKAADSGASEPTNGSGNGSASASASGSCHQGTSPADTRAVNDMTAPIRKAQASVARMVGPGWRW